MMKTRKNIDGEAMAQSNSNSEDDLHLSSNNNSHDCNLLLNGKKNPDNSIFDDSFLAMVSAEKA